MSGPGFRKFGNVPVVVDGIRFDSMKEAARWGELRLLEKTGVISNLKRQVKIQLEGRDGPIMTDSGKSVRTYVADFQYFDTRHGGWVIEDSKGFATKEFKIKKAILAAQGLEVKVS